MRVRFAQIISIVFHPLLMPTYLFLFIIVFASTLLQPLKESSQYQLLLIIFFVTFVIPAISIGTLRLSNIITDLTLTSKRQRFTPFLFVTCFYGVTSYMFYAKVNVNSLFYLILAITTGLLMLLTIITIYWKISIHGAGIGGMLGFILAISFMHYMPSIAFIFSASIVIAGLVIYSRLSSNAHTPLQVYTGLLLGAIVCYASMKLLI